MKIIYQVWGTSGDHEEYERNLLGTYADKALAYEHMRLARERLDELRPRYRKWTDLFLENRDDWRPFRGRSAFDKYLASEYGLKTDMQYFVARETVRTTVPA